MNFRNISKMISLVVLMAGTLSLSSCGGQKGGLPQSNEYPIATVTTSSTDMSVSYPAVIKGKQDVEIRPKVAGFITKLCVEEGAQVRAGQVLVTIDNVQYTAAYNQAKAALASAKSALATAELTYKNKVELHKQNIIGDFDLQQAQNNLSTAKAALEQAQASVSAASDNLRYCNVTSPSNGVIGTMPYRVGSLVSSSIATPLTTVSNIDQMHVYFSISEKQLLATSRESGKNLTQAFPEVKLELADGSIYEHTGKVAVVSGVIDQASGAVNLRADFANPNHLLKSGGTGNIIITKTVENAILIPQTATIEVQNKIFVYTVGADKKVKYTEITVEPQNDGETYIVTSGLKVGDKYVTKGLTKLNDGMEIEPVTIEQYNKNIEKMQQAGATQSSAKGFINTMTDGKK